MKQIEIARTYLGKLEVPGNAGFKDPEFEKEMKALGEWQPGYAWCACFAQMVFRKAFPEKSEAFKKLFDPSTRKTLENFKAAGYTIFDKPILGSLVIWGLYKDGKLTYNGHAGIVSMAINDTTFMSIEGNTGASGSRNGDRVFEHTRTLSGDKSGLDVMGFIKVV